MLNQGITEIAAALAKGEYSSVELTQAYLAEIGRHNPDINAYITVTGELALAQASLDVGDFAVARSSLARYAQTPTRRVATMMATTTAAGHTAGQTTSRYPRATDISTTRQARGKMQNAARTATGITVPHATPTMPNGFTNRMLSNRFATAHTDIATAK